MRHDREYRILSRSPSLTYLEFWKYLRPRQNSCSLVMRLRLPTTRARLPKTQVWSLKTQTCFSVISTLLSQSSQAQSPASQPSPEQNCEIKDRHCGGLNVFFDELSPAPLKGPPTSHQAEVRDLPLWSYCQFYLSVRLKIGVLQIRGIRPRSGDSPRLKPLPIFTSTAVDAATQFLIKIGFQGCLISG